MKFIIYLLFFIFSINLFSNEILISKVNQDSNILDKTDFYIDIDSEKSFEDIKSNPNIFKAYKYNFISQGFTTNTIWLNFSIKNDTNKRISKFLELDNTMIDEIILYENFRNNKYIKKKTGVMNRKEFNSFMRYKFKINLDVGEIKEYILEAKSETSGLYFHLNLLDEKEYYTKDINYQQILVLFFGAILALCLYNIFIFFLTKDLAHLYYSIYIFFTTITHISFTSMNLHILPLEFESIDAYLTLYYTTVTSVFMMLFSKEFLETAKYPKINFGINIFLAIYFISFLITLFSEYYPLEEVTYILLIGLVYTLFSSFYMIKKGNTNAKYFAFGWGFCIIGYLMLVLKQDNLWSLIDYFPFFYEFSILTEAILFSFALARKINKTKELENSLKTNEVLTRELHHRVKNNMQFIILMYRLKLANLTTPEVDLKLKETEGAIQAMSKTHEILYNQENLENIDTKLYFKNLIDELKRSYNTSKIDIKLDISTSLDSQKSIYCGIILNELLTNCFKYAFPKNIGKINISLKKENNKTIFILEDNGIGFDYEEKKDESFGLSFIEEMVKNELKGKIQFKNNKGTKVVITI